MFSSPEPRFGFTTPSRQSTKVPAENAVPSVKAQKCSVKKTEAGVKLPRLRALYISALAPKIRPTV
jgi:hypothetical protein